MAQVEQTAAAVYIVQLVVVVVTAAQTLDADVLTNQAPVHSVQVAFAALHNKQFASVQASQSAADVPMPNLLLHV